MYSHCPSAYSPLRNSITADEIVGAFEIATIHNGHPSYFLSGWEEFKNDESLEDDNFFIECRNPL